MRLTKFQVMNFRSIDDSGLIDVEQRTVLVGRNESGKTNVLLALHSLNPPGGVKPLSYVRDFPRGRNLSEFEESLCVVKTLWNLSAEEQSRLAAIFPRAAGIQEVMVQRSYKAARQLGFIGLAPLLVDQEAMTRHSKSFERMFKNILKDKPTILNEKAGRALNILSHEVTTGMQNPAEWGQRIIKVVDVFRKTLSSLKLELTENAEGQLQSLLSHAESMNADETQYKAACDWVLEKLPLFIYLDEYPELPGHQNIKLFLQRMEKGQFSAADEHFARLCKVAELNPKELAASLTTDHRHRQLLTNRAGAIVTEKLRDLWSNRPLKVRFHLDAEHFDTLVSDSSDGYDMEVNLAERSRGFQWFFSFYVAFAADSEAGKEIIILLDEPGMALHALAQRDLLSHFQNFRQPILYTTHSPFMVPPTQLGSVRTVVMDGRHRTQVSNRPQGDAQTLFTLQTALAYAGAGDCLGAEPTLLVESLADYWYLEAARLQCGEEFADLTITPAGGAQRIAYLLALQQSVGKQCAVLLGQTQRLAAGDSACLELPHFAAREMLAKATVEDLFDGGFFYSLVTRAYVRELAGRELHLDDTIAASMPRYVDGFAKLEIRFKREQVARYWLAHPEITLDNDSRERFRRLFMAVKERQHDESKNT